MTSALEQATRPLQQVYSRAYPIGFPQVRTEIAERIMAEQNALMPMAIGALLIALFLLLRQLLDILTPLLTAGISILWTFGLMGWLGIPINVVTSTVPILLIVVGSTEDIHLLAEFRHAQRCGDNTEIALEHMARKMGRTVLLTFLTTYAGFLSVGLSGIEALSQFGLIASTGLLFNFIVTIVFIPPRCRSPAAGNSTAVRAVRRTHIQVVGDLLAVSEHAPLARLHCHGVPGRGGRHRHAPHPGQSQPDRQPGDRHPRSQRTSERLNEQFAGLESVSVVLESGIQETFLHSRYLDELVKVQRFIQEMDSSMSVTSFADYLVLLNNAFQESDDAGVPASNEEIAELMIFLDHERVSSYRHRGLQSDPDPGPPRYRRHRTTQAACAGNSGSSGRAPRPGLERDHRR